jgi:hypothetical protein
VAQGVSAPRRFWGFDRRGSASPTVRRRYDSGVVRAQHSSTRRRSTREAHQGAAPTAESGSLARRGGRAHQTEEFSQPGAAGRGTARCAARACLGCCAPQTVRCAHSRSPFPPDPQTSEAVQPRKGSFHDPAVGTQSCAVQDAAAGDRGHDAASADLVAVDVVAVAAVGEQGVRLAAGVSDRPRTGGIALSRGSSSVTSLRLPPVSRTASGVPRPSVIRWCFEPARPWSTGERPMWLPLLTP